MDLSHAHQGRQASLFSMGFKHPAVGSAGCGRAAQCRRTWVG